jgi:RNA polymerase sigma-70 factor (ECF subfamily)
MPSSFGTALAAHRPELLRHCYRMLGSFADAEEAVQDALASAWKGRKSYSGAAPLRHWLFRIATNTCLNARKARRRALPNATAGPARAGAPVGDPVDPDTWITPAPDDALYPAGLAADAAHALQERESISLAFVALLQRLPPRQRAVLLLKDVVGFSSAEIADALDLSVGAVSSALHRARAAMPADRVECSSEPPPEVVREYVRCWERRELKGLLALLRRDVVLAMPPWPVWFRGRRAVERFLTSPRFAAFWSSGIRVALTRANGQIALVFHRDRGQVRHSIQLPRFDGASVAEIYNLVGPTYLHGFPLFEATTEQFGASPLS